MQVQLLTWDQMIATGWTVDGSGLRHPDRFTVTHFRREAPQLVEIASPFDDVSTWRDVVGAGAGTPIMIVPAYAMVGRLRTDLTEEEWFRAFAPGPMRDAAGKWLPLHGGISSDGRVRARLPGDMDGNVWFWHRSLFESSPVVDLAFGRLLDAPGQPGDLEHVAPVPAKAEEAPRASRPKQGLPVAAEKFRDAPRIARLGLITCGFELETQKTEDATWESIRDDEPDFDEDGWMEAVDELVSEIIGSRLEDNISSSLLARVRDAVRESAMESVDRSGFEESADPAEWMRTNHSIPRHVEVVQDTSVDGFEFRTRGPRTYMEFLRASRDIFRLDHEVDVGCSFHIHLAVRDVKHKYGERMQMALVEYLVSNMERVPARVRERWASDNQYIRGLVTETEKYAFIRFHPQGTWEFRCFGNVADHADAKQCLDLAVDAMQFAYRAVSGEAHLIADSLRSRGEWQSAVRKALVESKPLAEVVADPAVAQVA